MGTGSNAGPTEAGLTRSYDGILISYRSTGRGERALVFVHGWSCDQTYWRGQVDTFSSAYRVITLDLAGHGESGDSRSSWTMPAFGKDVIAVADALQLHDMVLVGHSMGGDVITNVAMALPDRVAGIVWVDTYRRLTEPETPEQVDIFMRPFEIDFVNATRSLVRGMFRDDAPRSHVEEIVNDMASAPPEVAVAALRQAFENEGPVMAALPELRIPVIAINPDHRPTDVASLTHHGVEVVIASGVGHFLMLEDPEQFNRLLADVLDARLANRPASSS